jgi:hypothetical protein
MPEFLKGNYKVDVTIEDKVDVANSTDEFEKKALSRLGGSICFVSKKGLMWQGEVQPQASRATPKEQGEVQPVAGAAAGGEATTRTASRATPGNGDKDTAGGAGTKNRPGA